MHGINSVPNSPVLRLPSLRAWPHSLHGVTCSHRGLYGSSFNGICMGSIDCRLEGSGRSGPVAYPWHERKTMFLHTTPGGGSWKQPKMFWVLTLTQPGSRRQNCEPTKQASPPSASTALTRESVQGRWKKKGSGLK